MAGHGGGHSDGTLTWLLGFEPTVTPLQERGPERPVQWCGDGSAPVGGPCSMTLGHEGDHQNGQHIWHQARGNYRSTNLAGAKIDDLILDLFRRVERLEEGMNVAASVAKNHANDMRAWEKRVQGLEQAQVYGPGPHDLSVLQASIVNHVNQALTDLGSGLDSRFTLLTEALRAGGQDAERRHRELEGLLNRVVAQILGELKPVPSVFCGAAHPVESGRTCVRPEGHTAAHKSSSRGSVRLVWNDEPAPAQNERASGSPAAVRCPAQFREGQCLGYAGHEGECSALPDPREPQLENPEEFDHTSYASLDYLNRRGVPDEPEECGNPPAPGSASPPCGRPAGHTGVCASGPQYSGEDEPGDPFEGDGHGDTSHSV